MPTSEEFLQKVVEERGIATREQIAGLMGRVPGGKNLHLATALVQDGLMEEGDLGTLLVMYTGELEKEATLLEVENSRFGAQLVDEGLTQPSAVWTAIGEQEKARSEGRELSLDWFLDSDGSLAFDTAAQVLEKADRKVLECRDCGRREIVAKDKEKPACPECKGVMVAAGKPKKTAPKNAGADPLIGQELGGCIIETMLGKGGMGAVYKARHLALNKTVAVKLLSKTLGSDMAKKRFLREARTAAQLEHQNVVLVYDTGTDGDAYYIVMQFVEGQSAAEKVRAQGPLPVQDALDITIQAAKGIAAAHKIDLIHRDIKPDNLMIDEDGVVKVADFGLAKQTGDQETVLTADGQAMGTPNYMSPEQAKNAKTVGPSTDIYSLGASLFTLLSGKPPFEGSTPWMVVSAALNDPAPDIRTLRSDVPDDVAELILKTMEKEPENRPESMKALAAELEQIARGTPAAAETDEPAHNPAMTLDDFKTPPPGADSDPVVRRTPELEGKTLDDFPTPATISPDRAPARTGWAIPAIIIVAVLGAAAAVVFLIPGILPGSGGTKGNEKKGGSTSPENDQDKKPSDEIDKDPGTDKVENPLAAEADAFFQKAKAQADTFLAKEDYSAAIAAYAAMPESFRGTSAWDRKEEEKGRIYNFAIERLRKQMGEMNDRFEKNQFEEARAKSVEISGLLETIRKELGKDMPEDLQGVSESFEKDRERVKLRATQQKWLSNIENGFDKAAMADPAGYRDRLGKIASSDAGALADRAKTFLSRLDALEQARENEKKAGKIEELANKAAELIDGGDLDGANRIAEQIGRYRIPQARAAVSEIGKAVASYKLTEKRLNDACSQATALASTIRGVRQGKQLIEPFKSAPFAAIKSQAWEAQSRLDRAEKELLKDLEARGYAVIEAFSGRLGSDLPSDANPPFKVNLKKFAMAKAEVSCARYKAFLDATGRGAPLSWRGGNYPEGLDDHPVTGVTATDAEAYASWLSDQTGFSVRLPVESEWEVAARLNGNRLQAFPWGDGFDKTAANLGAGKTMPVGTHLKDKTSSGICDLAGNVSEWTLAAPGRGPGKYAVRGGCFDDGGSEFSARGAFRQAMPASTRMPCLGFRVVIELE